MRFYAVNLGGGTFWDFTRDMWFTDMGNMPNPKQLTTYLNAAISVASRETHNHNKPQIVEYELAETNRHGVKVTLEEVPK